MGKAWKFGDNISTDLIAPGRYFHLRSNLPELAKHVLEGARPEFALLVQTGDFVVAGENFGLGSSREHAPIIIKLAGAKAVLAKSFARIFYRNCINIGLPAITCNTDEMDEGDELLLDMEKGVITNKTKGVEITFPPLPPVMNRILQEGGLVAYIKAHKSLEI
ncbi:3-isopropylmalate dehydratase small subunit [Candidatus Methanoperedens nitratireducens]|uniref:3-isopropylmalate dehydratase small subunit n=1 Tax=Candidatus Methanoperedens nitratireducens TaxID=1392998 RepID=A0A284VTZ7_9EURY|nr:3-isopropylmalate dehydratase small subunit [Candidatus Methanoperedens nitroreducens]SNQ62760.1 3-isopropylmalate dehydratase small subunit 2 [Candidatus Methanoperedens nitroreducens]